MTAPSKPATLTAARGMPQSVPGDIRTVWNIDSSSGDWSVLASGALATGHDLESAILISLFTDRTAERDDVLPDRSTDRRGWWADLGEDVPIGSRLWLLDREKQLPQTLARAVDYAGEALQWLISDGLASDVAVTAEWARPALLYVEITITRNHQTTATFGFAWAWGTLNDAV